MLTHSVEAWVDHIASLQPDVIQLGLSRIEAVLAQIALKPVCPVITVAGTNGKGSVCAFLERVYESAGFRTGCYTSPHLIDFRERIRLRGSSIQDAPLCTAFAAVEAHRGEMPLSYFEFMTLAAFLAFTQAEVDLMIFEVGLGGRLDAVNVFDADCAVVTSVDLDHQQRLGQTREAIAIEKAGIFRGGRAAICADPDPPITLQAEAERIGARWVSMVAGSQPARFGYQRFEQQWDVWCDTHFYSGLPIPALRGDYQLNNAAAALAVVSQLHSRLPVDRGAIRQALVSVNLPGRFQVLPGAPTVVLDVAHNPHAARALAHNLSRMGLFETTRAVVGVMADKDIPGIVSTLSPLIDEWLLTDLPSLRAAPVETLVEIVRSNGGRAEPYKDPVAAFEAASRASAARDRIVVFGSFLVVGPVLQHDSDGRRLANKVG